MIKINIENETRPLSENSTLKTLILDNKDISTSVYDCENSYISFAKINDQLDIYKPKTFIQVLVLPPGARTDLICDITALRTYGADRQIKSEPEIAFNSQYGKLFITQSELLTNTGLRFDIIGDDLLNETQKIELDQVKISLTKDLSLVPLKVLNVTKFINIK